MLALKIVNTLKIVSSGYADRRASGDAVAHITDKDLTFQVPAHRATEALVRLGMDRAVAGALVEATPVMTILPYWTPRICSSVQTTGRRVQAGIQVMKGPAGMTAKGYAGEEEIARGLTLQEWEAIEAGMVAVNVHHAHCAEVVGRAYETHMAIVEPRRPDWAGAAPTPVPVDVKLNRDAPMEQRIKQWLDRGGLSPAQEDALAFLGGDATEQEATAAIAGMHLPEVQVIAQVAHAAAQGGYGPDARHRAAKLLDIAEDRIAEIGDTL